VADGRDADGVGGDRGPEVVLLVDDDVGSRSVHHRRQISCLASGDDVEEHSAAEVQVRTTVVALRLVSGGLEHLVVGPLDRDAGIVGRKAERFQLGHERASGGEGDPVAAVASGAREWHDRIEMAVGGQCAEQNFHEQPYAGAAPTVL
jgi:hypothetical protein